MTLTPGHLTTPPANIPAPTHKKRVLLVDDEPDIRDIFRLYLEESGYEVEVAENGSMALELMHTQYFDLLVSDLCMPVMNGFTLIRYVQLSWPTLPIIILSGSLSNFPQEFQNGVTQAVSKPVRATEFLEVVNRVLAANP